MGYSKFFGFGWGGAAPQNPLVFGWQGKAPPPEPARLPPVVQSWGPLLFSLLQTCAFILHREIHPPPPALYTGARRGAETWKRQKKGICDGRRKPCFSLQPDVCLYCIPRNRKPRETHFVKGTAQKLGAFWSEPNWNLVALLQSHASQFVLRDLAILALKNSRLAEEVVLRREALLAVFHNMSDGPCRDL